MMKVRNFAAFMAIGALAALPGCSMFGGGHQEAAATAPAPAPAPAPPPAPTAPPGSDAHQNEMSHSLVRQVQTQLKQNHMYAGRIDGVWGPMTRRGVTRFQQKNNIATSGELDDATLQAMNLTPAGGENNATSGGGSMNDNTGSMNGPGGAPPSDNGGTDNTGSMTGAPPPSGPGAAPGGASSGSANPAAPAK